MALLKLAAIGAVGYAVYRYLNDEKTRGPADPDRARAYDEAVAAGAEGGSANAPAIPLRASAGGDFVPPT